MKSWEAWETPNIQMLVEDGKIPFKIIVVPKSAYDALQARVSLAEQDRDSWKRDFITMRDAANEHVEKLEARITKLRAALENICTCGSYLTNRSMVIAQDALADDDERAGG